MSDKIIEALKRLDLTKDEHWTADGLPKVEALGIEGVKRADVTKAAPHFKRDNPVIETPAETKAQAEAQAAKAAQPTLEERHTAAKEKVDATYKVLHDAKKAHDAALQELDLLEREIMVETGRRNPQHGIMDYLAAQKKARAERIARKQA